MTTPSLLISYGFLALFLSVLLLVISEVVKNHRITRGIITALGLVILCGSLWGIIIGFIWKCVVLFHNV